MIEVTSLQGKPLFVNADLIATVESTPDTVVTLSNGRKLVVAESAEELVSRFMAYKSRVLDVSKLEEVR
jgi:flagellar protein FlbD